jgi:UDP-N-acetylglucosamine pyrophosphorylase
LLDDTITKTFVNRKKPSYNSQKTLKKPLKKLAKKNKQKLKKKLEKPQKSAKSSKKAIAKMNFFFTFSKSKLTESDKGTYCLCQRINQTE